MSDDPELDALLAEAYRVINPPLDDLPSPRRPGTRAADRPRGRPVPQKPSDVLFAIVQPFALAHSRQGGLIKLPFRGTARWFLLDSQDTKAILARLYFERTGRIIASVVLGCVLNTLRGLSQQQPPLESHSRQRFNQRTVQQQAEAQERAREERRSRRQKRPKRSLPWWRRPSVIEYQARRDAERRGRGTEH